MQILSRSACVRRWPWWALRVKPARDTTGLTIPKLRMYRVPAASFYAGGTAMSSDTRLAVERLVSVQRALSPESARQRTDIVVESLIVTLASGDLSLDELKGHLLEDVWPGAGLTAATVEAAVDQAKALGFIAEVPGLDGPRFAATSVATSDFADFVSPLEQTRNQLAAYVGAEYGRALRENEAEGLLPIVTDAVAAAIRESFAAYEGSINQPSDVTLMPDQYDLAEAFRVVDTSAVASELKPVLRAFCVDAFDVSIERGSTLVTVLATGYVMHAVIARRDQLKELNIVGSVASEWLLIDTPLLFTLLATGPATEALRVTFDAARDAGVYVIVPELCMEEVSEFIGYVEESGQAERVGRLISDGRAAQALYQLSDNIAVQTWLSHVVAGRKLSWPQFCKFAYGLNTFVKRLGYTVYRGSTAEPSDRDRLRACRQALHDEMDRLKKERGPSVRVKNDAAIYVDGQTMAMASRQREGRAKSTRFWPGAWIVTPDKRMDPAYKRMCPDDEFSLTISPAQLGPMLTVFAPTKSPQDLARSAARLLSHETLVHVASRYPPTMALQMARSLSQVDGPINVDVRAAQQLSIDDLLASSHEGDPDEDKKAAAALIAQRSNRVTAIATAELARTKRERDEAIAEQDALKSNVADLREEGARTAEKQDRQSMDMGHRIEKLEDRLKAAEHEADQAKAEVEAQRTAVQRRHRIRRRRSAVVGVALLLALGALFLWLRSHHPLLAIALGICAAVTFGRGWPWADEVESSPSALLPTLVMEVLAIVVAIVAPEVVKLTQ